MASSSASAASASLAAAVGAAASTTANGNNANAPRRIVIAVVGDPGVGRTSLITSAAAEAFSDNPPPTVPVTRFPPDLCPEGAELLVVDTPSPRAEDDGAAATAVAVRAADAVVLCFDASRRATLDRLGNHWLPLLARMRNPDGGEAGEQQTNANANADASSSLLPPVVVACCKADADDALPVDQIRESLEHLIQRHPAVEVSIRTSARQLRGVQDCFYHAAKCVLYPKAPLLDAATGRLTTPCVKALLRIFLMCDTDGDGALSDAELNTFQFLCFGQPLTPDELGSVRAMVAERMADGLGEGGLLFPGFMYLHTLFLTRGRLESTWAVLRMFGYDGRLHISRAALARLPGLPGGEAPATEGGAGAGAGVVAGGSQHCLELSSLAAAYLGHVFDVYESSRTGVLSPADLEHMFNRAPVPAYKLRAWSGALVAGPPASSAAGAASSAAAGLAAVSASVAAAADSGAAAAVSGGKDDDDGKQQQQQKDSAGGNSSSNNNEQEGGENETEGAGLTREAFLARWRAFALADPRAALEQMMYLGMGGRAGEGAAELFDVRPRRRASRHLAQKGGGGGGAAGATTSSGAAAAGATATATTGAGGLASRSVVHCGVFGGLGAGKGGLVKALAGRGPRAAPRGGPLSSVGAVGGGCAAAPVADGSAAVVAAADGGGDKQAAAAPPSVPPPADLSSTTTTTERTLLLSEASSATPAAPYAAALAGTAATGLAAAAAAATDAAPTATAATLAAAAAATTTAALQIPSLCGLDVSRLDVGLIAYDAGDLSSMRHAVGLAAALAQCPGAEGLPLLLVAAKADDDDEEGEGGNAAARASPSAAAARAAVAAEARAAAAALGLPAPLSVSALRDTVLLEAVGGEGEQRQVSVAAATTAAAPDGSGARLLPLWAAVVDAALARPERHQADTPLRRARRAALRRAGMYAGAAVLAGATAFVGWRLYASSSASAERQQQQQPRGEARR